MKIFDFFLDKLDAVIEEKCGNITEEEAIRLDEKYHQTVDEVKSNLRMIQRLFNGTHDDIYDK